MKKLKVLGIVAFALVAVTLSGGPLTASDEKPEVYVDLTDFKPGPTEACFFVYCDGVFGGTVCGSTVGDIIDSAVELCDAL